jgi:hypothetical protein
VDGILSSYWTRELEAVFSAYYDGFYTESEFDDFSNKVTKADYAKRVEQAVVEVEPLLIKLGYISTSKNRQRKSLGSLD